MAALVDRLKRALGVGQKRPPDVGELDTARVPDEQLDTELGLERVQPRSERGLGQKQPLRGTGDAALFGGGDEPLELSEQHTANLPRSIQGIYGRDPKKRFEL